MQNEIETKYGVILPREINSDKKYVAANRINNSGGEQLLVQRHIMYYKTR